MSSSLISIHKNHSRSFGFRNVESRPQRRVLCVRAFCNTTSTRFALRESTFVHTKYTQLNLSINPYILMQLEDSASTRSSGRSVSRYEERFGGQWNKYPSKGINHNSCKSIEYTINSVICSLYNQPEAGIEMNFWMSCLTRP